ncbi:MAG: hypothetical protein H7A15_11780 [Sinobacteraceae bacterium]|nr:hypothetical protein [Nevskiaceae bacterium]
MKLDQLPLGARFEYKGRLLTKTGPLTGATEQGGSVLIPRFAVLKAVEGESAAALVEAGQRVDTRTVLAAFEAYHCAAMRLADEPARMALTAARARFLESLGKPEGTESAS